MAAATNHKSKKKTRVTIALSSAVAAIMINETSVLHGGALKDGMDIQGWDAD